MIYGQPPLRIETDITDRIGIRTLIYSQRWQPSRWPMSDADLQDEKPPVPGVAGGMLLIGDETRAIPGGLRTFWTFEGIGGDGKTVTFRTRTNSIDYSFTPGMEQMDIRKHPKIQELIRKFGGMIDHGNQQIVWPENITADAARSAGLGGGGSTEKPNPMFGRNEYLQFSGTYSYRYAAFNPPRDEKAGQILEGGLPGRPPLVHDCNWLQFPSEWRRRGIVYDIKEVYLLSGPGGWPEPIHNLAAGGRRGGLSTGSLSTSSL